ncbi:YugN family protein [Oceanobacillus sojae]|uniref:YugN family protein n=1 Tax=Oceanobacillus sojae TaxID=582851 RepID=UPI0009883525|nr:YugN family protein [Oceanobacillus sojae]MCT1902615.1 YugN-like family protein [Oceanobacillus sojae]
MIVLETHLPGKRGFYQKLKPHLEGLGFHIAGKNSRNRGCFNGILTSRGERKLYLSLPYQIIYEEHDQPSAQIEFGCPLIINHAVHSDSTIDWKLAGEQAVQQIINHIDNNL